ncbi:hypothetical protein HK096_001222, partial [Nowakowskiella sp. JEL0078]
MLKDIKSFGIRTRVILMLFTMIFLDLIIVTLELLCRVNDNFEVVEVPLLNISSTLFSVHIMIGVVMFRQLKLANERSNPRDNVFGSRSIATGSSSGRKKTTDGIPDESTDYVINHVTSHQLTNVNDNLQTNYELSLTNYGHGRDKNRNIHSA